MIENIGLLLPRSVLYPSIGFDIVGGLRQGLAVHGQTEITIKTENIGTGGDDKLIYAQCERLLFEGVKIVVGYMNPASAEKLGPLFAAANAIFILLDAGYHFPTSTAAQSHVFTLSLQGALCARVAMQRAIADGHRSFAYTCSFYDSGYRAGYAFSKSLEAGVGHVTYNHITALKRKDFSLDGLADHLDQPGTDAIFASFCGDMALDFFSGLSCNSIFRNYPVYCSSFSAEEDWLAKTPHPGGVLTTCVPWARELKNDENLRFTNSMKQKANVFSLLGYEAADLVWHCLFTGDLGDATTLLEGYEWKSPRGHMVMNKVKHVADAQVYEAEILRDDQTGCCRLGLATGVSPFIDAQREDHERDLASSPGPFTSWLNAYACLES